ncbi:MAG: glutathione S-transferase family protein [Planctomycetota bacterium]
MTATLVTIGVSHYCEKARWALDRAGAPYVERRHPPVLHVVAAWRAGGGRTVPVLVDGARRLADSSAILAHVDEGLPPERRLYPADPAERAEVERWEDRFDEVLGPHVRRFVYGFVLDRPETPPLLGLGARLSERLVYRACRPLVHGAMRRLLRIDAAGVARSQERIDEVFAETAERIAGRRYLVGERFSAADLSFAALAAPLLSPARYGVPLPTLEEMPPELRAKVEAYRAHPAGAFALRLYDEER